MYNSGTSDEKIIVVDWGTATLRAFLVTKSGTVLARRESPRGIQLIEQGNHEDELLANVEDWLEAHGALNFLALGMITSRNGWVEVPYVPCPASLDDLANGVVRHKMKNGSSICFLAGITDKSREPFPDVMRGEETQIVGHGLREITTVVLPGTHCKWAQVSVGHIGGFQTFVTGEIFALLCQHSFIGKASKNPPTSADLTVFDRGTAEARAGSLGKNPLLSLLFSARTGMLAGKLHPDEIQDYVSGLLIGYEFREARECGWFTTGDTIAIVGNDGLNARYKRAAVGFGLTIIEGNDDAVIHGALEIFSHLEEKW